MIYIAHIGLTTPITTLDGVVGQTVHLHAVSNIPIQSIVAGNNKATVNILETLGDTDIEFDAVLNEYGNVDVVASDGTDTAILTLTIAGIDTGWVGNLIGCAEHDLGWLISRARKNGEEATSHGYTQNVAFNISEVVNPVPAEIEEGEILGSAEPYWNIFSNISPGVWAKTNFDTAQNYFKFRLKSDYSGKDYTFVFGDFKGYNHVAIKPYVADRAVANPFLWVVYNGTQNEAATWYFDISLGSYHFDDFFSNPKIGLCLYKNGSLFLSADALVTIPRDTNTYTLAVSVPAGSALVHGDVITGKLFLQEAGQSTQFSKYLINQTQFRPVEIRVEDHSPSTLGSYVFIDENSIVHSVGTGDIATSAYIVTGLEITVTMEILSISLSSSRTKAKNLQYSEDNTDWHNCKYYSVPTGTPLEFDYPDTFTLPTGVIAEWAKTYYFRLVEVGGLDV